MKRSEYIRPNGLGVPGICRNGSATWREWPSLWLAAAVFLWDYRRWRPAVVVGRKTRAKSVSWARCRSSRRPWVGTEVVVVGPPCFTDDIAWSCVGGSSSPKTFRPEFTNSVDFRCGGWFGTSAGRQSGLGLDGEAVRWRWVSSHSLSFQASCLLEGRRNLAEFLYFGIQFSFWGGVFFF